MRSVIYITIILASLTATSLSATAATVNNAAITKDVPDVLTLCDPFAITGEITGEADTDVYYGGLAYSTYIRGPYHVLTTGEKLSKDSTTGEISFRESFWRILNGFTNLTVPTLDIYTFGILTVNIPLGIDTTLKHNTITSFGQSNKLDGGNVFLTVKNFPPSDQNLATNQMLKATATCRSTPIIRTVTTKPKNRSFGVLSYNWKSSFQELKIYGRGLFNRNLHHKRLRENQ